MFVALLLLSLYHFCESRDDESDVSAARLLPSLFHNQEKIEISNSQPQFNQVNLNPK
jgi:hypothetical protein